MRARWVLSCTLGEATGIALVALVFATATRGIVPAAPAVLSAGAWEGLCLGTAQALVLRSLGVRAAIWIAATVAVAVLGYAGSRGAIADVPNPDMPQSSPPLWLMAAGIVAMGAGLGAVMGAAQALAARPVLPFLPWVGANAVGWIPAMIAIFLPAGFVTDTMPLAQIAAIGALSGAVAGLCVGLATAAVLPVPNGAHA